MININNKVFELQTKDTTYCFHVLESGQLEHLYYGRKVEFQGYYNGIMPKCEFVPGNCIVYDEKFPKIGLEDRCLETSSKGKGDIREPMIELIYHNGSSSSDFVYDGYSIINHKEPLKTLPYAYDDHGKVQSLVIDMVDKNYGVRLKLIYSIFYSNNVIVRSAKLINESEEKVKIKRILSVQLDLYDKDYVFSTFHGAWAREMNKYDVECRCGITINDSKVGTSSNRSNPFVMLSKRDTSEENGDCYGCNIIYSGNHYEAVEVNSFGKTRLSCGINPYNFSYLLNAGDVFEAPEVALTYSHRGFTGMSHNMHGFVREHIVRGAWKTKNRPILINSWEASYFNFNKNKLLKLAKAARDVGIELFVLDDGWFGKRNDDTSSLGDWYVDYKKLSDGLDGLAKSINELGMDFGIWVEPEMVNRNSECYRLHPEYAVEIPNQHQSLGRNQLILDLTKNEVQNYIVEEISKVLDSANITYVKWDMNRVFSDLYSTSLAPEQQEEFSHRYIVGLYCVLERLTKAYPSILFEGCASGGNRFDLGMLCYMPQIWASDNTDAQCRAIIQTGYSYGYPMSVVGSHVSGCPNHQTLRNTPLDSRFNIACFGLLGYELNLAHLNKEELQAIKNQVTFYKKYREILQFGDYYRLYSEDGIYKWNVVSKEKDTSIGLYFKENVRPNDTSEIFKTKGLEENKIYNFSNRPMVFDIRDFGDLINTISPINIKQDSIVHNFVSKFVKLYSEKENYTVSGSVLNNIGIRLHQSFGGVGYNENIRYMTDFGSRLYIIEETTKH